MESLTPKAQQHTTWHKSQVSAWALEDNKPLGVAHRHTPNLPNLRFEGPIILELGVIVLKAQRPVFVEGERTHPDPWPGPGASTTDFGCPFNGISTARGGAKQNIPLCGEGAACCPLYPSPFPLFSAA